MCSTDIFLGLLALLFPPLPVWVKRGICSADSIINILLCVLGFIPGLIHAWYIIAKYPEPDCDYESLPQHDRERGHVYVYVHDTSAAQRAAGGAPEGQPKPQNNMSYGATNTSPPPPQGQGHAGAGAGPSNGGEGSSDGAPPPSYAAVVAGDHKVQTQD